MPALTIRAYRVFNTSLIVKPSMLILNSLKTNAKTIRGYTSLFGSRYHRASYTNSAIRIINDITQTKNNVFPISKFSSYGKYIYENRSVKADNISTNGYAGVSLTLQYRHLPRVNT